MFLWGLGLAPLQAEGRESLIEKFNQSESERVQAISSEEGETLKDPQMGAVKYRLRKKLDQVEWPVKAPATPSESAAVAYQVRPPAKQSSKKDFSYSLALKNAIPCFKDFLSSMIQARAKRDDAFVDCQVANDPSCDSSQILHQAEKKGDTLAHEFQVCLHQPG